MRRDKIATGEYYHVLNRGFEKMDVFRDEKDAGRFLLSIKEFNSEEPIGSIYENAYLKKKFGPPRSKKELVEFVCYCLNPNHYHFLVRQLVDDGLKKFMQRLGGGYTKYFNEKYKRSGYLFQGPYKLVHVDSNEYLLHLSVYINLNFNVHQLGPRRSKSSWDEFLTEDEGKEGVCKKNIILDQFSSREEYKDFAQESLGSIIAQKGMQKMMIE